MVAGVTWPSAGEYIGDGGLVADTGSAVAGVAVTLTADVLRERLPDDGHRLRMLWSWFTRIGLAVYRDSCGTVWMPPSFCG